MQIKLSPLFTRQINIYIYLSMLFEIGWEFYHSLKWKYSTEAKLCGKGESIFPNRSSTVLLLCNFQCNLWYQMHSPESWELSVQVYLAISLWVGGGGKRPLNSCKITITASILLRESLVRVQRKDKSLAAGWPMASFFSSRPCKPLFSGGRAQKKNPSAFLRSSPHALSSPQGKKNV